MKFLLSFVVFGFFALAAAEVEVIMYGECMVNACMLCGSVVGHAWLKPGECVQSVWLVSG